MVHMRDSEFVPKFLEHESQANGIRPSGYPDQNAVVRSKHVVFLNGLSDLRCEFGKHAEMPKGGLEPPS